MRYPIVIEPGGDTSAFGVIVPDLPGCFSAGDTLDEAMDNTVESIELHLEALLHDHAEIPHPSPIEIHSSNPDYAEWVFAVVEVDLAKLRSTTKRYNITMSERVMAMVDTAASQSGESRSAYLTKAAVMRVETGWIVTPTIPYHEMNAANDAGELPSGNEDTDLRRSA